MDSGRERRHIARAAADERRSPALPQQAEAGPDPLEELIGLSPSGGLPAPRPRGGSRTVEEIDRIAAAEAAATKS